MIRLSLPYPPSANRYWRNFRGRVVVSEEAEVFKRRVADLCEHAGIVPVEGRVGITLDVFRPRKSGDLDNSIKVCLDAIQGWAYLNDNQVVTLIAHREDDKTNPRVEVQVWEVE